MDETTSQHEQLDFEEPDNGGLILEEPKEENNKLLTGGVRAESDQLILEEPRANEIDESDEVLLVQAVHQKEVKVDKKVRNIEKREMPPGGIFPEFKWAFRKSVDSDTMIDPNYWRAILGNGDLILGTKMNQECEDFL